MLAEDVQKLFEIGEHHDDRGFSLFFATFPLPGFHIASLEPGATRGDHVHVNDEFLCVMGSEGMAEIILDGPETSSRIMVLDRYHLIRIPAGVKHTIRNVGDRIFYLLSFFTASP